LLAKWPDAGWRKCLEVAAKHANWGTPLPQGQGRGIAIGNFGGAGEPHAGCTVAAVAAVAVKPEMRVLALDIAFDCGQVLNMDAVRAQLEGSAIFGMNMALHEEITIENGRVVEGNFDRYRLLRMGQEPGVIECHWVTDDAVAITGLGEPSVPPLFPALANAIARATGRRPRQMPFDSSRSA
jgi:isoquinoline 1-oxidoreductase beta subunit